MSVRTCEYLIKDAYRSLYNLDDEHSLTAFHGWVGKRISDALVEKYGRAGLDVIPHHEVWEDDLGLIQDCDFHEQPDGSLLVTFSRESQPIWWNFIESDINRDPTIGLSVNVRKVWERMTKAA